MFVNKMKSILFTFWFLYISDHCWVYVQMISYRFIISIIRAFKLTYRFYTGRSEKIDMEKCIVTYIWYICTSHYLRILSLSLYTCTISLSLLSLHMRIKMCTKSLNKTIGLFYKKATKNNFSSFISLFAHVCSIADL